MKASRVLIDHGSGGLATKELIEKIFLKRLSNRYLSRLEDSAVLDGKSSGRIALTTDSYVVDPIFFPGGDIGSLSVHGTINDLAMQGARPVALTLGLILEEGLLMEELELVASSIASASLDAGVPVVTADTKVVPCGKADKIFINTSGIGIVPEGISLGADRARPGDVVLVSGFIGDHGAAIMTSRANLSFSSGINSDSAPLHRLVERLLDRCPGNGLRLFRDPTRGGLATVLNEIAQASRVRIAIDEGAIPVRAEVISICELLGLDPLYLANEGKLVTVAARECADQALEAMKETEEGKHAAIIGEIMEVKKAPGPRVTIKTGIGGTRIVSMLAGEPLPRIC